MLEHIVEVILELLIPLCELMGICIVAVSAVSNPAPLPRCTTHTGRLTPTSAHPHECAQHTEPEIDARGAAASSSL